ncbi:MAG TPA: hypothetical protein VFV43_05500 [Limnobacter sp.]|nr:hypothetical protein [Limnobacter sp.]
MKFSRLGRPCGVAAMVLALWGCVGGESPGSSMRDASSSGASAEQPSGTLTAARLQQAFGGMQNGQPPLGLGCGWFAASDADKANIAFPDSEAKYWVAAAPVSPQTRVRIDGAYPQARYFSFNAYDAALRPTDAVADVELQPNPGSSNPFVGANRKAGGTYTAYLQYGPSPTQNPDVPRAANTFYTGEVGVGPLNIPNGLTLFIYRIYVSDAGEFFDGGAGLPTLTLETADGSQTLGTLPNCDEPLLPNLGGAAPPLGLNERLLGLDYPNELVLPFPTATYPPTSTKFFGLGDTAVRIAGNVLGNRELASQFGGQLESGSGGFLSNVHNAYTSTGFSRRYGSLALVRAKAPTFKGQRGVGMRREDLRYWSLCGNEFATQRYTECAADYRVPLDSSGYFTVVISDPADRPANAIAQNGFLWLPWGPYPDHLLLYRHMLNNPDFKEAIQQVQKNQTLRQAMGEYAPVGMYCRPEVFVQSNQPGQVFELCAKDQADNPPLQVVGR